METVTKIKLSKNSSRFLQQVKADCWARPDVVCAHVKASRFIIVTWPVCSAPEISGTGSTRFLILQTRVRLNSALSSATAVAVARALLKRHRKKLNVRFVSEK